MLESINKFVGQLGNLKESFFYVLARPSTVILLIAILVLCIVFAKVKKIKFSAKLIAQIGLAIALACVLQVLRVYRWPQGGSVTLGSMVPILFMGNSLWTIHRASYRFYIWSIKSYFRSIYTYTCSNAFGLSFSLYVIRLSWFL